MNVLVIAAHPDDEVLGCGGTMAAMAEDNHQVSVLILGTGLAARHPDGQVPQSDWLKLMRRCEGAHGILEVDQRFLCSFPDNKFDSVPLLSIVKEIEQVITKVRPEVVFTHHAGDLNIDHEITNRATLAATRPMKGGVLKRLLAYEVPSATDWAFNLLRPFHANTFMDISRTLGRKLQALEQYADEMREFPHPRSYKAIEASAIASGAVVGIEAAEEFQVIWQTY